MRRLLILIVFSASAAVLFSCGETEDFITNLNQGPQINFMGDTQAPVLKDSIKLSSLQSQQKYRISLRITDRNNNIQEVIYAQLAGTGKLLQDGTEILSNNIRFERDSSILEFDYYPANLGIHQFSLTVRDNFGLSKTAIVELTAFDNLLPVSKFTARKIGQRSRYEWKIDASESFDRDEKFGGKIKEYEFSVLGKIYTLLSDNMYVIFPETGIYSVGVRVKDNDGKWSAKSEIPNLQVD
jgi:hypothetical protein